MMGKVGSLVAKISSRKRRIRTEAIEKAMVHVHHTQTEEYSCDDAYKVLDVYAEIVARGDDPSELMPLVKLHLEICDNCREEFEALLVVLQGDS